MLGVPHEGSKVNVQQHVGKKGRGSHGIVHERDRTPLEKCEVYSTVVWDVCSYLSSPTQRV